MKKLPFFLSLIIVLSTVFGTAEAQAQTTARKGWSPQAKGSIIGGLGGAAAGALINKRNRAVGGVVGGVVGAGAGYAIGKHVDNKKKQKAAAAEAARVEAAREAEYQAAARREAARSSEVVAASHSRTAATASVPTRTLVAARPLAYAATAGAAATVAASMAPETAPAGSMAAFLPNNDFGNPAAPYPTSEYRRKSW